MKKIKFIILVICFMFIPTFVNAENLEKFEFNSGDNVTLEGNVDGSSVTVGTDVISKGEVNGVDVNFGSNLTYQGNSDYVLLTGLNVNVEGIINNDGLVIGDVINFKDTFKVKRDLFVFGATVNLKGEIDRNIIIYATNVNIDASIKGNIKIIATNISINDQTVIEGKLSYNENAVLEKSDIATIGEIVLLESTEHNPTFGERVSRYIMSLLGALVLFAGLNLVVPKLFDKIESNSQNKHFADYFSLLGYGALAFILIPILSLLLLSIPVLQPLIFLVLALYVIVLCLSNIFVGYLIGYIIWTKLIKKEENRYLIGLLGILIMSILSIVPALGTLITLIIMMLNIGIVMQLFRKN